MQTKRMTREERRQATLFDAHMDFIHEQCSEAEADSANIGWSQDDDCITSKIYSNPRKYVTTYYDGEDEIISEMTKD